MSERYFRVYLWGYGGEQVVGSITKEQYEFWKDIDEEYLISHAFWDPWDAGDDNPVYDDNDPRWLGQWYELDDILHENGVNVTTAQVTIDELEDDDYGSRIIDTVIANMDWQRFVDEYYIQLPEPDNQEEAIYDAEYTFHGTSVEKGCFGEYYIKTDGEDLNISKLGFSLTMTPNEDIILQLTDYAGQEVDNVGGDSNGKGYYANVYSRDED